ncbi:MAG: glycosyltransferase family 2 protein [Lachnospiraceae bacterium]|nr:glycosyltransferase family 2 protein [Lachnospiraceae bacterium]
MNVETKKRTGEASPFPVLAGIVLYEPEEERLMENLAAVLPQVQHVLLVDNHSSCLSRIRARVVEQFGEERLMWLFLDENKGIAYALARIMDYACGQGFPWVLTLDQDSVCRPGLVEQYFCLTGQPEIGQMGCRITDRNFTEPGLTEGDGAEYQEVPFVITSGSFMNVKWYQKTAGYDEKMFIDGVDVDISYALRKAGAKVIRIPFDGLLHEVGHGKPVKLLGKEYIAYQHSPERNYYIARNNQYLQRKYPTEFSRIHTFLYELRMELVIGLYEDQRWEKLKNRWKGIRDSRKM